MSLVMSLAVWAGVAQASSSNFALSDSTVTVTSASSAAIDFALEYSGVVYNNGSTASFESDATCSLDLVLDKLTCNGNIDFDGVDLSVLSVVTANNAGHSISTDSASSVDISNGFLRAVIEGFQDSILDGTEGDVGGSDGDSDGSGGTPGFYPGHVLYDWCTFYTYDAHEVLVILDGAVLNGSSI